MTVSPDRNATLPARDRGIILILLVAAFVVILNETIMNVALPRLMTELNVGASTVQWLATAFMLTMAVVIPTTGFILQRFSTRQVFIAAMGLFCAGTLLAGIAPGFELLLAGRVVQASGSALMLPLLITTILTLVPPSSRGAIMGRVSIVISVAPAIGPTLSGLILQALSWRFMFLLVLPVALLALAYGARRLVNVGETRAQILDLPSVLLSVPGFGGLVYGFSSAGEPGGWGSPRVTVALAVGAICLALFVGRQLSLQRRDGALLDLRVFGQGAFTLSTVMMVIAMMALFGGAILLPLYLQNIRSLSSLETGLLLLPGGLLMGLAAPTVGRFFDQRGPMPLAVPGAALLALTLWGFTTVTAATPVWLLLGLHLSFSLGLALLFTPVMTSGLNALPGPLYSHGSAVMSTLQMVAGAIGTALLVTVMTARIASLPGLSPALAQTAGLHAAFALAGGIAALAFALSFFLRRGSSEQRHEAHSTAPAQAAD